MNRQFLRHYNNELVHIREMAAEFARDFPKIAGRLALDGDGKEACIDPFVERLLEGFAFLAARVQLKFDAEFPRFTQSLLESVYPHYLAPVPSMLIAQFEPELEESGLATGYSIPRGTILRSNLGANASTPCEFRTAHEVKLLPLRLLEAKYYTRDIGSLALPNSGSAKAALVLKLEVTAGLSVKKLETDRLCFFIRGSGDTSGQIYEQVFGQASGVILQSGSGRNRISQNRPKSALRQVGFSPEEALLPPTSRSFEGYRLLREYFAFPQRFLFFEVLGIRSALAALEGNIFELVIPMLRPILDLENKVDASTFELFCTPAINLFPKRLDRIALSDRFPEYHVVADRTRPIDFEIYDITNVEGIGTKTGEEQKFTPFYFNYDQDLHSKAYYTINRVSRVLSAREKLHGPVSPTYIGSEVYLSLVDANCAPYSPDLHQLGVQALCTNRHLPIQMPVGVGKTDFYLDISAPVNSTRAHAVSGPVPPIASQALGELSWKVISHLSLNYISLLNDEKRQGAHALREILRLYAETPETENRDTSIRKQIEGVREVSSRPIIRRVIAPGPIAFARGLEITVLLQESEFSGIGVFILGAVLEQFFSKYVSINSFTETVITTVERGEIMRWPAYPGRRPVL